MVALRAAGHPSPASDVVLIRQPRRAQGRETLQATVTLVQQKLKLDVIYGDTDSIMINTGLTDLSEVRQLGETVRREVNRHHRLLEIGIDGVFKSMLLLNKKKYAALKVQVRWRLSVACGCRQAHRATDTRFAPLRACGCQEKNGAIQWVRETKGLDIVRRDWCELAHQVGNYVLEQILGGAADCEQLVQRVHEHLRTVADNVRSRRYDLGVFVITKGLAKAPADYPDKHTQPHVQVALRMLHQGKSVRAGEIIPYVICEAVAGEQPAQRAYHPEEIARDPDRLHVDYTYYLKSQVLPVVSRLCSSIEGTDQWMLAECLGLEAGNRYSDPRSGHGDGDEDGGDSDGESPSRLERFAERQDGLHDLSVPCMQCHSTFTLSGVLPKGWKPEDLERWPCCPKCRTMVSETLLKNLLTLQMRKAVQEHYAGWRVCAMHQGHRTRQVRIAAPDRCWYASCNNDMTAEYSARRLYGQLMHWASMFDWERAQAQTRIDQANVVQARTLLMSRLPLCRELHEHVQAVRRRSAYGVLSLAQLFAATQPTTCAAPHT